MRRIFTLYLFVTLSLVGMAQADRTLANPNFGSQTAEQAESKPPADGARLSPMAAMLRSDLEGLGHKIRRNDTTIVTRYNLVRHRGKYYVQALIIPTAETTERTLKRHGVHCSAFSTDGCTALIDTRRFVALTTSGLLELIDVSAPLQPRRIIKR